MDTYFDKFIQQAQSSSDLKGLASLLTACVHKLMEQATYQADVTFLFCVYAFLRGCTMIDSCLSFETFVDQMHGKKFKYVKPGSAHDSADSITPGSAAQQTSAAVTPEVFILQVDLLTSCTTDLKTDQYKCVTETKAASARASESKADAEKDQAQP